MGSADQEATAPVPRHLSRDEIRLFLLYHESDEDLQRYLLTARPDWGVVVESFGASMLVWYSKGWYENELHVIDVTGNPIIEEIEKAPYVSADDDGFFSNLNRQIQFIVGGASNLLMLAIVAYAAFTVYSLTRR